MSSLRRKLRSTPTTSSGIDINDPSIISDEFLMKYHSRSYIECVSETANYDEEKLLDFSKLFDNCVFNKHSAHAARSAAGAVVDAVGAVVRGSAKNSFCLTRPPGHHAMKHEACGFCIFSNVAVAAKYALDDLKLKRVLIVDWDVHFGQGTQYAFYDDKRVLFMSVHRYEDKEFWPNLREANYDYIGKAQGAGFNINIPLNVTGLGDSDYLTIFHRLIMPIAYEFNPELVIVSAGFDCAKGCPLGMMNVNPPVFAYLTNYLMNLASGKLVMALEGGYCLESLSESICHCVSALAGFRTPSLPNLEPIHPNTLKTIEDCVSCLRPYWSCLSVYESSEFKQLNLRTQSHFDTWKEVCEPSIEPDPILYSKDEISELVKKISNLVIENPVSLRTQHRVALSYNEDMENHFSHHWPDHPESPLRTRKMWQRLKECELLDKCEIIEGRMASKEEVLLAHDEEYLNSLLATKEMSAEERHEFAEKKDSIYMNENSVEASFLASGTVLSMVDAVCEDKADSGFAIVRPPGHHAESGRCMGFCFLNSVAIAVNYAKQKYHRQRVLIVDWDVHHGNGVQEIFIRDPDVLYVSLHRHDRGSFFPGGHAASAECTGEEEGLGRTVNIAWNGVRSFEKSFGLAAVSFLVTLLILPHLQKSVYDLDYITAFYNVVLPLAYEFRPEIIFVSAGFDAVRCDPLGGLRLSPEVFGHFTRMLLTVSRLNGSKGGLVLALEGGYQITLCASSLTACITALLGESLPCIDPTNLPSAKNCKAIRQTISNQKNFWKCLSHYNTVVTQCLPNKMPKIKTARSQPEVSPPKSRAIEEISDQMRHLEVEVNQSNADRADDVSQHSSSTDANIHDFIPRRPINPVGDESDRPSPHQLGHIVIPSSSQVSPSNASTTPINVTSFLGMDPSAQLPNRLYAVQPMSWCSHLEQVRDPNGDWRPDITTSCHSCDNTVENWVCLTCYGVFCGRYSRGHMLAHYFDSAHPIVLSYADLSSWCYSCEAYVHNDRLVDMKRQVHLAKFGQDTANA